MSICITTSTLHNAHLAMLLKNGTVKLSGCARMRFWMGVGQPVPWPSVPERDHLGMRLALLPFRRQLSRRGGVDGDPWSAGQLRDGPVLVR